MDASAPALALRLQTPALRALESHARAARPLEACGVLLGHPGPGGALVVHGVTRGRNLEIRRPEARFELDPAHWVAAEEAARARGLEVLGFWHSHPTGPARLSAADRREALEGLAQLVVGFEENEVLWEAGLLTGGCWSLTRA